MPFTRQKKRLIRTLRCLPLLPIGTLAAATSLSLQPGHIYQYGDNASGESLAISRQGTLFVSGNVIDTLDNQPGHGASDVFISAFSANRGKQWTRLLGGDGSDYVRASTSDSDGNLYITGTTAGGFGQAETAGSFDIFLTRLSADGAVQWTRQYGSGKYDNAAAIATDITGNIYVAGRTFGLLGERSEGGSDMHLSKFDAAGNKLWTRQFGTAEYDAATALTILGDSIYVAGYTRGSLDGQNHFNKPSIVVRAYTSSGSVKWTQQFGSPRPDYPVAMASGSNGALYLAGYTYGGLNEEKNRGDADVFVTRLNTTGEHLWTRMLGSDRTDRPKAMTLGHNGNLFVTGYTYGNLDDGSEHGRYDAFTAAWSPEGALLDVHQFGGRGFNQANSIAATPGGALFVLGNAASDIDEDPQTGEGRVFLALLGSSSIAEKVDTWPPNLILRREPQGYAGYAGDSEDINLSGILESGEDINGNGSVDFRSEDRNGNGLLEEAEDVDHDGALNSDSGLAEISLSPNTSNLELTVTPFASGALATRFRITRIDNTLPGQGQLIVRDIAGNITQRDILLHNEVCATTIDQIHLSGSEEVHIPQWASSPLDDGSDRPTHTLWITGTDNPALFSRLPGVSYPSWSLDYALNPGVSGSATVRYEVVDYATSGKAYYCGEESFQISVLPTIATPAIPEPIADDWLEVISGSELQIALLQQASAPDLQVAAVAQPLHGSSQWQAASATYRSDPGYTGEDSFSYWLRDDAGKETAHRIQLRVTPAKAKPVEEQAVPRTAVKSGAATRITAVSGGAWHWLTLVMLLGLRMRFARRR